MTREKKESIRTLLNAHTGKVDILEKEKIFSHCGGTAVLGHNDRQ
jgi:hypothetical protein